MKIKQISACYLGATFGNTTIVFGLGDDNLIYFWDDSDAEWKLYKIK